MYISLDVRYFPKIMICFYYVHLLESERSYIVWHAYYSLEKPDIENIVKVPK